jgi:hypothetical protein
MMNFILIILIGLCFWRIAEISHRLEMNIMVVQGLQRRISDLEKTRTTNNNDSN